MSADVVIIKPGARVAVGGDVDAWVLAVTIRAGGKPTYQVSWWDKNNTRKEAWVEAFEVTAKHKKDTQKIGFSKENQK